MASYPALADLLKNQKLPDVVLEELAKPPYSVTTVVHFANYFESRGEIKTNFLDNVPDLKDRGDVMAGLKQAWREAEAIVDRAMKRCAQGLPEEPLDDPLRTEVQTSLSQQFVKSYGFELPAAWTGTPSLVGRFHREFLKRIHVVHSVKKVRTMESMLAVGPTVKRARVGDLEFSMPNPHEAGGEIAAHSCAVYMYGLRVVCMTMVLAGSYTVTDKDGRARPFAPLGPVQAHLATAESYVVRHSTGSGAMPDSVILASLIRVDETIRGEWARMLRSDHTEIYTLGDAIEETRALMTSLWLSKPAREAPARGGGGGGQQQQQWQQQQHQQGGRSQGPRSQGSGRGGATPRQTAQQKGQGKGSKTARVDTSNRPICKQWNDSRGCSDPRCTKSHICDILLPSGAACGMKHKRSEHRGPTVPL